MKYFCIRLRAKDSLDREKCMIQFFYHNLDVQVEDVTETLNGNINKDGK